MAPNAVNTPGSAMAMDTMNSSRRGDRFDCLMRSTDNQVISIVSIEIQPGIQGGNLVSVAVKQQCFTLVQLAYAYFPRLGAPSIGGLGVDIGIKPVVARSLGPGCFRLLFLQMYRNNRLDALESIFPWNDQAQWGAVLIRHRFAI